MMMHKRVIQNALLPELIQPLLTTSQLGHAIISLPVAASTNCIAKELAHQNVPHGAIVLAEEQTDGRGRRGRSWQNTPGKDLCMSLLLRPAIAPQSSFRFTIATALGVHAMCCQFGMIPSIKWPNDLLFQGKKFCGILLEIDGSMEQINALIVGIGLNINTTQFPAGLESTATSMSIALQKDLDRIHVLSTLLNILEPLYAQCETDFPSLLLEYKAFCNTIGQYISITGINKTLHGFATDIDDLGRLKLQTNDGELHTLHAGDVSLRDRD